MLQSNSSLLIGYTAQLQVPPFPAPILIVPWAKAPTSSLVTCLKARRRCSDDVAVAESKAFQSFPFDPRPKLRDASLSLDVREEVIFGVPCLGA